MAASVNKGHDSNTSHVLTCAACSLGDDMTHSIQCGECKEWIHYYCSKLPLYNLMCLLKTTRKYTCEKCYVSKYLDEDWENVAKEAQKAIDEQASSRGTLLQPNPQKDHEDTAEARCFQTPSPQPSTAMTLGDSPENLNLSLTQQSQEQPGPTHVRDTDTPVSTAVANLGNDSSQPPSMIEPHPPATAPPRVCRYYRRGHCKYGVSGKGCSYGHPKPCQKYVSHGPRDERGCTLGRNCPIYHPVLCRNSVQKRECFKEECKLTHIKGTKRQQARVQSPAENEQPSRSASTPTPSPPPQEPHNGNFLEMFMEMKEHMANMNKVVEAQGLVLQNFMRHTPQQNQLPQVLPAVMSPMTPTWAWPRVGALH